MRFVIVTLIILSFFLGCKQKEEENEVIKFNRNYDTLVLQENSTGSDELRNILDTLGIKVYLSRVNDFEGILTFFNSEGLKILDDTIDMGVTLEWFVADIDGDDTCELKLITSSNESWSIYYQLNNIRPFRYNFDHAINDLFYLDDDLYYDVLSFYGNELIINSRLLRKVGENFETIAELICSNCDNFESESLLLYKNDTINLSNSEYSEGSERKFWTTLIKEKKIRL